MILKVNDFYIFATLFCVAALVLWVVELYLR